VSDFVSATLGPQFVSTSATDLAACYDDSNATTPLVFVLSQGSDPTSALLQFAGASSMFPRAYMLIKQGAPHCPLIPLVASSHGVFLLCHWTPLLPQLGAYWLCKCYWTTGS
jgi:hypothetical protein